MDLLDFFAYNNAMLKIFKPIADLFRAKPQDSVIKDNIVHGGELYLVLPPGVTIEQINSGFVVRGPSISMHGNKFIEKSYRTGEADQAASRSAS